MIIFGTSVSISNFASFFSYPCSINKKKKPNKTTINPHPHNPYFGFTQVCKCKESLSMKVWKKHDMTFIPFLHFLKRLFLIKGSLWSLLYRIGLSENLSWKTLGNPAEDIKTVLFVIRLVLGERKAGRKKLHAIAYMTSCKMKFQMFKKNHVKTPLLL